MIKVLNAGYVSLVDHLGDDLAVVNAARASFEKESHWEQAPDMGVDPVEKVFRYFPGVLKDKDARLIRYLVEHGHMSPFRHCALSFEVKAPLFVARQWHTYHVASVHTEEQDGWNEASRRYVTSEPEFYLPSQWRAAPESKKQGSGGPVPTMLAAEADDRLNDIVRLGLDAYEWALNRGIAPEQARGFLPAYFLYVTWRWTISLQGLAHMLKQRLGHDAQWEFQLYAKAVQELAGPLFPVSLAALMD
jgi:thymidylate synthase (FAD)